MVHSLSFLSSAKRINEAAQAVRGMSVNGENFKILKHHFKMLKSKEGRENEDFVHPSSAEH